MCEGVGVDSRHGVWHVDIQVGTSIILLECVCLPLHVYLGGEYPYRRIHLLGIAHPVVGKCLQVLEVH